MMGGGGPGFGGRCWHGHGQVGSWSGLWYMALVKGLCWLLDLALARRHLVNRASKITNETSHKEVSHM